MLTATNLFIFVGTGVKLVSGLGRRKGLELRDVVRQLSSPRIDVEVSYICSAIMIRRGSLGVILFFTPKYEIN